MPKIKYPYEFDPKKRKIAKEYRRIGLVIFFISIILSLSIPIWVLSTGAHIAIRDFALQFPFPTIVYGFLILLVYTLVQFPLTFYSNYIYQHQFKLSRYTISTWLIDFLKMSLVSYITTLILISGLYFTIRAFSPWWLYAGVFYILFSTTLNYVFPFFIVPFMWKTEPYRDRSMKRKILSLCKKLGAISISNIVVIRESEKSVRPNAFFIGFANAKKIGLFDTLLDGFKRSEIETVVGHELGHYINKDLIRGLILESILVFPVLFGVDYLVKLSAPMFGIPDISDLSSLVLIGLIYGMLEFLIMPITNTYSRRMESQADEFALNHIQKPVAQISTEKRLADMHLAEIRPPSLVEFWLFNHPSTVKRIKMVEDWRKQHAKS